METKIIVAYEGKESDKEGYGEGQKISLDSLGIDVMWNFGGHDLFI